MQKAPLSPRHSFSMELDNSHPQCWPAAALLLLRGACKQTLFLQVLRGKKVNGYFSLKGPQCLVTLIEGSAAPEK